MCDYGWKFWYQATIVECSHLKEFYCLSLNSRKWNYVYFILSSILKSKWYKMLNISVIFVSVMVPKFWGCKFISYWTSSHFPQCPYIIYARYDEPCTLCRPVCQRLPTDLGVLKYVQYEALGYACIKVLRIPWLIPASHFMVAHLSVRSYSIVFTYIQLVLIY